MLQDGTQINARLEILSRWTEHKMLTAIVTLSTASGHMKGRRPHNSVTPYNSLIKWYKIYLHIDVVSQANKNIAGRQKQEPFLLVYTRWRHCTPSTQTRFVIHWRSQWGWALQWSTVINTQASLWSPGTGNIEISILDLGILWYEQTVLYRIADARLKATAKQKFILNNKNLYKGQNV